MTWRLIDASSVERPGCGASHAPGSPGRWRFQAESVVGVDQQPDLHAVARAKGSEVSSSRVPAYSRPAAASGRSVSGRSDASSGAQPARDPATPLASSLPLIFSGRR